MNRTIPDEAWRHVGNAVFRDGRLYPDTSQFSDDKTHLVHPDSTDTALIEALSYFTVNNYKEWAGATVLCLRAPDLEGMFFRFDNVSQFIQHGYRNPYREAGVPDWYFFWVKFYSESVLRKFAIKEGFLPKIALPLGRGGNGIETGLRKLG